MTDEPYADEHAGSAHPDPELRAALATLVADEPPAPTVQDDVARGRALLRRRRTRTGAALGVAAVLVAVVAVGALLRPTAPVASPAQTPSPATQMAGRLAPVLASMGWTVTGSELVTTAQRTEIRLSLTSTGQSGVTGRLWVLGSDPDERLTSPYLASCTQETRPGTRQMTIADGVTATSGYEDSGALSGSLAPPGAGARMLDREYGTGSLVEVVSVPGVDVGPTWTPRPGPSPETAQPPGVLGYDQLARLLTAIGDPLRTTPSPIPVINAPACRDTDVKLTPSPASATDLGRMALAVDVDARNPDVRCTITGSPQVRVIGADGAALPIAYDQAEHATGPVLITQASSPAARAMVRWSGCRTTPGAPSRSLRVTLPGDDVPITVELPEGLRAHHLCGVDRDHARRGALRRGRPDAAGSHPDEPRARACDLSPHDARAHDPADIARRSERPARGRRAVDRLPGAPRRRRPRRCADHRRGHPPLGVRHLDGRTEPGPPPSAGGGSAGRRHDPGTSVPVRGVRRGARAPDEPADGVATCRAIYHAPRSVVVETMEGSWLAHLPRDACTHYSADLVAALGRASR
ncbi:MAG: DUF4232 domain-containing protein [Candidatus Nanopelagicales bacterium]